MTSVKSNIDICSKDAIYKVVTRKEMKRIVHDVVGIGSPFIIHDPDTFETYMVFTLWSDVSGLARRIWIAPIDRNLNVDLDRAREIVSPAMFGVTGLNTVTLFWDDYNEEWVFMATAYGGKASYGYVVRFDRSFNIKATQTLDFNLNLGDAGIGAVPLWNKRLMLSAGYGENRSIYLIPDYTKRPLPNPIRQNIENGYSWKVVGTYYSVNMDVHQLFIYNSMPIMLSEIAQNTYQWGVGVNFGPDRDWNLVDNTDMLGKWYMPTPIQWSFGKINYTPYTPNQLQHPHYTTELGKPLLFYITSPTWDAGGNRRFAHEIWAEEIDPSQAFDPRRNFPLIIDDSGSSIQNIGKIPIPTFGAKRAVIHLYGLSAKGTLQVIESSWPAYIWKADGDRHVTSYQVGNNSSKIVIDNPAPYIALSINVQLSRWSVLLTN